MLDEYGDIPGLGGSQYASLDTVLPEKDLHVQGTTLREGGRLTFWLFNPPGRPPVLLRCGICKGDMSGHDSCPSCFSYREK